MAESAIIAVVENVSRLVVHETTFLCGVTVEVELLKDELKRLRSYLKDTDNKWRSGKEGVAILVSQIRDAAYEAENVIEDAEYMQKRNRLKKGFMGAISRYARLPTDLITLHKIGVEIQRIRKKIKIFDSTARLKIDLDSTAIDQGHVGDEWFSQDYGLIYHSNLDDDDVFMIGFENEYKKIVDKLVDKQKKMLSVVSIVATGGAGKTTLARKVYTSSEVKQHFETLVWVTVSQKFKSIDLLKDIMKQITGRNYESINQMQELGKEIQDFLLNKRYLVVLDDVWETDTWEQINSRVKVFPDAGNGSTLLLTTRKVDVANHIQMPTFVYNLKLLDEEKSWKLFISKALPSYKRDITHDVDELEELGEKISRKCNGLPLALAVLGGYLSKNLNKEAWSDVLLDWPSTRNGQMMRDILARSYKDLPNQYLRSCFLYLAAFPEDREITVSDLIELWIAESFIPHTLTHKPEEIARKYVNELAQRSLVQVVQRSRAHGWIETIKIHDILHEWCIQEAMQDGFLDVIDKTRGQAGASSSSSNIMISYRSSFQNLSDGQVLQAAPSNLRTLFCFGLSLTSLPNLRFLRVLHVQKSRLKDFSKAISGCIHLRFLRLRNCEDVTLHSSIGELLYLQTIDLIGTILESVPNSIWEIPTLRHVYLSNEFSPPRSVKQKELQTLELCALESCNHEMVTFLGQMTHLTTFIFSASHLVSAKIMDIFANMPHLVDIYVNEIRHLDKLPESSHFPQNLQSLSLSARTIGQDPMPILEKLPYLVVLTLKGYKGETMSCSVRGFPRLQELNLLSFDCTEWRMEVEAMPKLSHLELWDCEKMSKLPEGLLHLPLCHLTLDNVSSMSQDDITLKELKLKGCEVDDMRACFMRAHFTKARFTKARVTRASGMV